MRRLPKFSFPNIHFVTTNVFRRHPVFNDGKYAEILLRTLHSYRVMRGAKIYGYVLMPDHVHILLHLPEERDISSFIRDFRKLTAKNILGLLETEKKVDKFSRPGKGKKNYNFRFWQEGFFDFNIYSERKFREKLNYMHNDPVKRRLVDGPEEYAYSSYGHYAFGYSGYLDIDQLGGGSGDPPLPGKLQEVKDDKDDSRFILGPEPCAFGPASASSADYEGWGHPYCS